MRPFLLPALACLCAATEACWLLLASADEGFHRLGALLYWVFPPLLLAGLLALGKAGRAPGSIRKLWPGILLALALAAMAGAIYEPRARVQWDESDLYSASLAMAYRHNALAPEMALPGFSGPETISLALSKRPGLYPFSVSLAHATAGASPRNPFRVNAIALTAVLLALYAAVLAAADLPAALAAMLLAASNPLLFWVGTSGAMDLVAMLAVGSLAWAAAAQWREPSAARTRAFLLAGVAASYARYETVGVFALLAAPCLWKAATARGKSAAAEGLLALPFLVPLGFVLAGPSFRFSGAGDRAVFSASYALANFPLLLRAFFLPGSAFPFVLEAAGLAAVVAAMVKRRGSVTLAFLAVAASFPLLVTLSFFDASPLDHQAARLYLLPSTALALAPLLLRTGHRSSRALLAGALLFFCATWALRGRTPLFPDGLTALSAEAAAELSGKLPPGALVVFDPPGFLVARGVAAVSAPFFAQEGAALLAQHRLRDVFWIRTGTEPPLAEIAQAQARLTSALGWREEGRVPLAPVPTVLLRLTGAAR